MVAVEKSREANIAKNTSARLHAVQAVYQIHASSQNADDVIAQFKDHRFGVEVDGDEYVMPDVELFSKIVSSVYSRREDLLSILKDNLKKDEKVRNVENLLKSILLCGTLEIVDNLDIDAPIIINDYVEVTKAYYGDSEASLVNATLDNFAKSVRL